jgi:hypothetical protein
MQRVGMGAEDWEELEQVWPGWPPSYPAPTGRAVRVQGRRRTDQVPLLKYVEDEEVREHRWRKCGRLAVWRKPVTQRR